MLTMSILLMPLYCEICRAPAFALASVPLAVIDIAAPPRPLSRRRIPPAPPLPEPPPSTVPSWRVNPVPMFSKLVRLRLAEGKRVHLDRIEVDALLGGRGVDERRLAADRHALLDRADLQIELAPHALRGAERDAFGRVRLEARERYDERIGAARDVIEDELTGGARDLALGDAGLLVGQFDVGAGQDASRCVDHDAREGRRGPLRPRPARHTRTATQSRMTQSLSDACLILLGYSRRKASSNPLLSELERADTKMS